jgi:hypothetical protein
MADALARLRDRRLNRAVAAMSTTRSCEDCDLCCSAMPIAEFDKPPGPACDKLCGDAGSNCSIYQARPKLCREFHCMWRMSDYWLPDWAKPSECGFVMSFNSLSEWPAVVTVHPAADRPDSWKSLAAQTVFTHIAEEWNCMVAIGTVPWTVGVIAPTGEYLSVADNPRLMDEGGVGLPDFMFGPDKRSLMERAQTTVFKWSIPAPEKT